MCYIIGVSQSEKFNLVRFLRLGMTGIDGIVRLQLQAPFGKRGKTDQKITVNKEDKFLGSVVSGVKSMFAGSNSYAQVYA